MSNYDSLAQENFVGIGDDDSISRVEARLREAEVGVDRFADIVDGTKEAYVDFTQPSNQFGPESVEGNYGVVAGDGLVWVDVDDWSRLPEPIETILRETSTFRTSSPHAADREGHYAFVVEEGVDNYSDEDWGEIRARNQYVVGPSSRLTDCKHGCCTTGSPGHYHIADDRPIATLSGDYLELVQEVCTDEGGEDPPPNEGESLDEDWDGEIPIRHRVEVAKESKHGEKFTALWEGRYRDAGFDNRSDAEASLVSYLAFYLQGDKRAVQKAMNIAVSKHPKTQSGGPRKWNDPSDGGELYRDTTLELVEEVDGEYTTPNKHIPGFRPDVSSITWRKAYGVLLEVGIASTAEIAEHEEFDRSQEQARRAMKELEEEGMVDWVRDGRRTLYYPDGLEALPPEARNDAGVSLEEL